MREINRKEPRVRNDTKGKWRHRVSWSQEPGKEILTDMSWNSKHEAEDWVLWNNFDEALYGEIIKNPDLPAKGSME